MVREVYRRLFQARQNLSVSSFFIFVLLAPFRKLKRAVDKRALVRADSLQDRFTVIYKRNAWGSRESVSGSGSTLEMTESIRISLPYLFKKFDIHSMFDAPCGDFNWMRRVDLKGLIYVGADIVEPLVLDLQKKFSSSTVTFSLLDITKDPFPKSDLVLNRDCLFHLSYEDILATLANFLISGSKYFLSTSYENRGHFLNKNIRSGDFRLIDLFASPFKFPKDFYFEISERGEGGLPPRKLYLWDREQVQVGHSNLELYLSGL